MSFELTQTESVPDAVRRVAAEQLDRALAAVEGSNGDLDALVHEVRRRCKRVRALARLVRPSLADFADHDDWLRETAATLSNPRDAAVLPLTHAAVVQALPDAQAAALAEALDRLRRGGAPAPLPEEALGPRLANVADRLAKAREEAARWRIEAAGFDAIRDGLRKTYTRSRRAMATAIGSASSADCHQWRKRVKYHTFHMQLLRPLWPAVIRARAGAADELGNLLGEVHDLAVYRASVERALAAVDTDDLLFALRDAASRLSADRLDRCWPLGERLFALKPGAFVAEMAAYWDAWAPVPRERGGHG